MLRDILKKKKTTVTETKNSINDLLVDQTRLNKEPVSYMIYQYYTQKLKYKKN